MRPFEIEGARITYLAKAGGDSEEEQN